MRVHALPVRKTGGRLPPRARLYDEAATFKQRLQIRAMKAARVIREPIEPKSAEHWRFQWHEEVLKRRDLLRSEIAICGVLMHQYDVRRGIAEIGLAKLAARSGCSRATAANATQALRALGLIGVENEGVRTKKRTHETCRYRLIYRAVGVV